MNRKISYTQQGDYLIPNLTLPEQDSRPIGIWGKRHLRYIEKHRKILYTNMFVKCKLNKYPADINEQVEAMYEQLIDTFARQYGCTEELKATTPMLWIQKLNNASQRAREVVNQKLIFA